MKTARNWMTWTGLALLPLLVLAGCSSEPTPGDAGAARGTSDPAEAPAQEPAQEPALEVAALSYPAAWLVERLGGDRVETERVIPAGEDPRFWRPPAEVIVELQDADLIVLNGAGYEAWTAQANLPLSRMVDSAADLDLIETVGRTHSHGAGGEHSHAGLDPHTWMDPDLYLEQARRVDAALQRLGVETGGLERLASDLAELTAELEAAIEPLRASALAANHPSFAYLARRFELEIEQIDLDPRGPSARRIEAFDAWAEGRAPVILLWIEEPSEEARGALGEHVTHLVIDPLEQPSGERYDYLAQMRDNVERLRALGAPAAG